MRTAAIISITIISLILGAVAVALCPFRLCGKARAWIKDVFERRFLKFLWK